MRMEYKISEPKTLVGVYCAYIIYVITPTYICAHMHTIHKILSDQRDDTETAILQNS